MGPTRNGLRAGRARWIAAGTTLLAAITASAVLGPRDDASSARDQPEAFGPGFTPPPTAGRPADQDPIRLAVNGPPARRVVSAVVYDTRAIKPQIQERGPWTGAMRTTGAPYRVKPEAPGVPPGEPNAIQTGEMIPMQRVTPGPSFPAIEQTPWNPPDPALAVGPNHIVETVNMSIAFFAKDGTLEFSQRLDASGIPGFFEDIGAGGFTFDPKCFYDHRAGRFVVLALERYGDTESWITIAISDDDDPHGVWFKYRTWSAVDLDGRDFWVDYPGFGFDDETIVISGNLFPLDGLPGFGGAFYRVFDKTPMLAGDPVNLADVATTTTHSTQIAQTFGDDALAYLVSRGNTSTLRVQAITDPFGDFALHTISVAVPYFVPPTGGATNLQGGDIATLDGRLMNVHWRDGSLFTTHGIDGGDGTTRVRWYNLQTNGWPNSGAEPAFVAAGNLNEGSTIWNFFPAIATNANGDVAIVMARSGLGEFASVHVAGRHATDPPGTISAPIELHTSTDGTSGRWGDYFDIAVDPVDDLTFWVVGEYYQPSGWATWIGSVTIDDLPPLNDLCEGAIQTPLGARPFTTLGATADGLEPGCASGGGDIWFRVQAPVTGTLSVDVCDADFDTWLAVYGVECPGDGEVLLGCNDDGCGVQSALTLDVVAGDILTIRIGGSGGGSGTLLTSVMGDCVADLDGSGFVDTTDLLTVLGHWGTNGLGAAIAEPTDVVDTTDVLALLAAWGVCP